MPTKTLKLIEAMGVSRAARALGVSTTTLHKARKNKLVSRVIEVAADGALRELSAGTPSTPVTTSPLTSGDATMVYLLEAAASKGPLIEKFARAIGAHLLEA